MRAAMIAAAVTLTAGPAAAVPLYMAQPEPVQRQRQLREVIDLRGLVERLGESIERVERIAPNHWRVSGARCHVDVRIVRVRAPGEGLVPPRYEPRADERICAR